MVWWIEEMFLFTVFFAAVGVALLGLVCRSASKARFASFATSSNERFRSNSTPVKAPRVCVGVVLVGGDLARSPRMQYHATSMATCGLYGEIRCVGTDEGNKVAETLSEHACVKFILVTAGNVPGLARRFGWLGRTVYRVLGFILQFLTALWRATARADGAGPTELTTVTVVVQTPPAVPFLALAHAVKVARAFHDWILSRLYDGHRGSNVRIVIDFHNIGHTLLTIDHRPRPVVLTYRLLEEFFGAADAHFTVSMAMCRRLTGADATAKPWLSLGQTSITVLHDTAPDFFVPCSVDGRAAALSAILETETELRLPEWVASHRHGSGDVVLVSSTSWTADDDYSLVVDALKKLDQRFAALGNGQKKPRVWLLATGKGATRAVFEEQVRTARFSDSIAVTTHYFQSFKSYAKMLSIADAGLCVHRSSSGIDLPMKCVDMFGAGLPVIALDYPAIGELVTSGKGWLFADSDQLEKIIFDLVDTSNPRALMHRLKQKAMEVVAGRRTWDTTWRQNALPVLTELLK